MLVSIYSPVSWIRYILVPVTRIELGGSNGGIRSEEKFTTLLRKMVQPETVGVRTTEDEEEITIPYQEREDLRMVDIRGEQLENTQREGWLLPTEPRHGAQPRQTPISANFATAVEMLAMKAFGDMGQTDPLRLIRDRFIAGHNSCDLRRHLDSAPPETPIRDVVDRCRV